MSRSPRTITSVLLLVALLAACLAAPAAQASTTQTTLFEAPRDLLDPAQRDGAIATMSSLGVKAIRLVLYWRGAAPSPDSAHKPDFDTTNPASYDWGQYDAAIDAARAQGWQVLLTVSGPVPKWATVSKRDNVTNPRPTEFAQFMQAAAEHFGDRVQIWSIWNEPNHPQFLQPQYDAHHKPASPKLYRALYKAALKGFKAAGLHEPTVLFGETAPRGTGKDVAPLTFLRGVLCLDSKYRKAKGCGMLPAAGYAHHAYTTQAGPTFVPPGPNDVTIAVLPRLVKALDRAGKAGAIPRNLPIYLTEFGIQSTPDPIFGVSLQKQAEYRAISEHIAYETPRVAMFSQYLLRDDTPVPNVPAFERYSGFESGLETSGGKPKPALDAFRLPLVAQRAGSHVALWGLVRPAGAATSVEIDGVDGGTPHAIQTLTTDALGYWHLSVPYKKGQSYEAIWTAPDGTAYSGGAMRVTG